MASYVNLDTIQRPSGGANILAQWGDQVNDNFTYLYTIQQRHASMYLAGAQSIPAASTTTVTFDTIVTDPSSMCSTVNHNITIPGTGFYVVAWAVAGLLNSNPQDFAALLYKNAVEVRQGSRYVIRGGSTNDAMASVGTAKISCNLNDTITIAAYNGGSNAMNLSTGSAVTFVDIWQEA